jgi:uncharacterized membrane protein YbhN (UPF0104 family)
VALAGCLFAARAVPVPEGWEIGTRGLQILGFGLVAAAAGYLALCATLHDRAWKIRGHEIRLPPLRLALLQIALSAANWLTIAAILFVLLGEKVPYVSVLGVFLLAAIAGAIAHIPAGLGVIEVVFLTVLGDTLPRHDIVAALVLYRAVYYLAPLAAALALYAGFEASRPPAGASARRR